MTIDTQARPLMERLPLNRALLERLRGAERAFVIGMGPSLGKLDLGALDDELVFGVNHAAAAGIRHDLLFLADDSYPTAEPDCNVAVVRGYRDLSHVDARIVPGYSSHDRGPCASTLAVAAGARMVEKHVKFGATPWWHFDDVALDLESGEFSRYVREVRRAERACGLERKRVLASEHHKYDRRSEVPA